MHKIETNSEWMNANWKRKIYCSHGCMCISREDKIGKWRSATGTTVSVWNVNDVKMFSWNTAHEWKKDAEKSATHIPMFPFHFVVKYARGAQPLVHLLPLPSSSACASLWQCFCTVFFSFRFCFICILLLNVSPLSLMVENLLVSLKKKTKTDKISAALLVHTQSGLCAGNWLTECSFHLPMRILPFVHLLCQHCQQQFKCCFSLSFLPFHSLSSISLGLPFMVGHFQRLPSFALSVHDRFFNS